MTLFDTAHRLYTEADARKWQVAYLTRKLHTRADALKMADAIGRGEDTVTNLAYAYRLFGMLILWAWKNGETSEPIRQLRRKYPYTRWMTVYRKWDAHEFSLEDALDWLENFNGGNDAMSAEIENKYGLPEWERQAFGMYSLAGKLLEGSFGVPDKLRDAAKIFVDEYKEWESEK